MLLGGRELLHGVVPATLAGALGELPGEIRFSLPLAGRTTIGVGGRADCLIAPQTIDSMVGAIQLCRRHKVRHMLLGAGSNLLFSDQGYRGVLISTERLMGSVIDGETVNVSCGEPLAALLFAVGRVGVRTLDFLVGIPGRLGGAIAMNAGIPTQSIGDIVQRVTVLSPRGEVQSIGVEECRFVYRGSAIRNERLPVLSAQLCLSGGTFDRDALLAERRTRQPLAARSAGSTFKNPPGLFAGRLIEEVGLKGFRVGMAKVSEQHANFIVNLGGAQSAEISEIIDIVRQKVYKRFRILLELEIEVVDQ